MTQLKLELNEQSEGYQKLLALAQINPAVALPNIGEALVNRTRRSFGTATSPYGERWQPLKPITLQRRRGGGGRPLQDTRVLYNSISWQSAGNLAIAVGSSDGVKARVHQFGNPNNRFFGRGRAPIPARPFLPIQPSGVNIPQPWQNDIIKELRSLFDRPRDKAGRFL